MLTWNAQKIEDLEKKREERPGFLDCLIWAALAIGMNEITASNAKEWAYRIERYRLEGKGLFMVATETGMDCLKVEEKDITPWIGLKTNVGTISAAAFDKRMRQLRHA